MQKYRLTLGAVLMALTGLVCWSLSEAVAGAQGLESRVTALEREVAALQSAVNTLTAEVATLGQPHSATVIFAFNRPFPFNSDPVDTSGDWTKLTMSIGVSAGGFICGYALQIPDGSGGWIEQIRVRCDCGASCDPTVVPVISDTMRLSTGTASGSLTAAGLLEK
jgi:hypothetical protein